MAKHSSFLFYISFIFASIIFLVCDASNDENSRLHVVYMGSVPKGTYSPISHHLSILQQVIGDGNDASTHLVRSYKRSFNGFAAKLNDQQREKLSNMEGVTSVFPSKTFHLQTTRSWDFIGLGDSIKRNQSAESDVVIGVIDSGIWPESESFNDEGFGPIPKKWRGTCAGGSNFTCNKKIIGARYYGKSGSGDESARDLEGHGTHTASTAAGNRVNGVSFYGLAQGTARGAVPSARIAVYRACNPVSGCSEADILAAFDDSIADGVDIITISIGKDDAYDFDVDGIAIGAFHAMDNGVLTVQSAGNNGPESGTVSSVAPWLLTVAASSIDRRFIDKVILGNGKTLYGRSVNSFVSNGTKFSIAKKNVNRTCIGGTSEECDCVDSDMVNGKLVLCEKLWKEESVHDMGAIGSITKDGDNNYNDVSYVTFSPSLILDSKDYALVRSYTNSTRHPQAEILKSEVIKDHGAPKVASFSSRGPNSLVPEILKPDISAPGVDILAAFSPEASPSGYASDKRKVKYSILSGTSMSCPHVAGVAAYLKTFHPDWSPAAIKSAIMTAAQPMNGTYDLSGEFAYGTGNLNPQKAIDPGLVYDISKEDYVQMLCNYGYDAKRIKQITGENTTRCNGATDRSLVKDINYPALVIKVEPMKPFTVKIKRTVTNVGFASSSYKASVLPNSKINITVEPALLSFKSMNEKQSFVVSVVGVKPKLESVFSSSLVWSDGTHSVRSPIVVLCQL